MKFVCAELPLRHRLRPRNTRASSAIAILVGFEALSGLKRSECDHGEPHGPDRAERARHKPAKPRGKNPALQDIPEHVLEGAMLRSHGSVRFPTLPHTFFLLFSIFFLIATGVVDRRRRNRLFPFLFMSNSPFLAGSVPTI